MTIVQLGSGSLRGATAPTKSGEVQCYLGVPFAAPPVGALRFRPPAPVEPWPGVRDATRFAPAAPQNPDPFLVAAGLVGPPTSEEECLNLNVWTPRAEAARRPVLVWIHGGAYVSGSNSSGTSNGSELAASLDVVVVAINYRLGVLGFLHLEHLFGDEYRDSGNVAILDHLAALRWVRDNIAAFGGNPENVTIVGESAGGAAVATLLGTPSSEGLFRRAIVQSGTAERARTVEQSIEITSAVLAAAGLDARSADRLRQLPIEDLLSVQQRMADDFGRDAIGLALPFQPVVGGDVVPDFPLAAIRRGVNSHVDLLAGTNLNEASFFTELRPKDQRTERGMLETLVAVDFEGSDAPADRYSAAVAADLGTPVTDTHALEAYLSDRVYRQPTNRLLDAREGSIGANYAYLFTWPSPLMGGRLGACHALDVPFVFRQLDGEEAGPLVGDNPPRQLSDSMSEAWTGFARTGTPQAPGLPNWPVYSATRRDTMILDVTPRVQSDPRPMLREFWSARTP